MNLHKGTRARLMKGKLKSLDPNGTQRDLMKIHENYSGFVVGDLIKVTNPRYYDKTYNSIGIILAIDYSQLLDETEVGVQLVDNPLVAYFALSEIERVSCLVPHEKENIL